MGNQPRDVVTWKPYPAGKIKWGAKRSTWSHVVTEAQGGTPGCQTLLWTIAVGVSEPACNNWLRREAVESRGHTEGLWRQPALVWICAATYWLVTLLSYLTFPFTQFPHMSIENNKANSFITGLTIRIKCKALKIALGQQELFRFYSYLWDWLRKDAVSHLLCLENHHLLSWGQPSPSKGASRQNEHGHLPSRPVSLGWG